MTDDERQDGVDDLERRVRSGDAWAAQAWIRIRWAAVPGRIFARFPRWARWTYIIVVTVVVVTATVIVIDATS